MEATALILLGGWLLGRCLGNRLHADRKRAASPKDRVQRGPR